jgi:hypothetical protein
MRKDRIQRLAAGILEYEHHPPFVTRERKRPGRPAGVKFGCERVFVLESSDALGRRSFGSECHSQNPR